MVLEENESYRVILGPFWDRIKINIFCWFEAKFASLPRIFVANRFPIIGVHVNFVFSSAFAVDGILPFRGAPSSIMHAYWSNSCNPHVLLRLLSLTSGLSRSYLYDSLSSFFISQIMLQHMARTHLLFDVDSRRHKNVRSEVGRIRATNPNVYRRYLSAAS